MIFTIVHEAQDNGMLSCYGKFGSRKAAERRMQKMEQDIELDSAGGGDRLEVCSLKTLDEW